MSSKNLVELSGKSLFEVLVRMFVEYLCRYVLFCQVDVFEYLGIMGFGLCIVLWICSVVYKINI